MERPDWNRFDTVRSITELAKVALAELFALKKDLTTPEERSKLEP